MAGDVTTQGIRAALLARLAAEIDAVAPGRYARVAIDGVDGAGKTVLAGELAARVTRPVVRATVDAFLNPAAVRHARGRGSPEGFYRDSVDLAALHALLLDPLAPGGDGRHRTRAFDHVADAPVDAPEEQAPPGAVLILDGIFTHRPELAPLWDWSLFLRVPFAVSVPRGAVRGQGWGGDPDPRAPANRRYVEGQRLYLAEADPEARATRVVDNRDLDAPVLIR
jgi:uridine kinase